MAPSNPRMVCDSTVVYTRRIRTRFADDGCACRGGLGTSRTPAIRRIFHDTAHYPTFRAILGPIYFRAVCEMGARNYMSRGVGLEQQKAINEDDY